MKHLVVGTILIALGLLGISVWWETFGLVMRALVPFALLVVGLLAVLSSYFRLGTVPDSSDRDDEELAED
jgi:hypothetical protein